MKNIVIRQIADPDFFEVFVEDTCIGAIHRSNHDHQYAAITTQQIADIHAPIEHGGKPLSRYNDLHQAAEALYNIHSLNQSIKG